MDDEQIIIHFNGVEEKYFLSAEECNFAQAIKFAKKYRMKILPRWKLLTTDRITEKSRYQLISEQISSFGKWWVWAETRDVDSAWLFNIETSASFIHLWKSCRFNWNVRFYALCGNLGE